MRRMIVGSLATLLACSLFLGAREASAKVDVCKRQCLVVFKRGGSNCVKKVTAGIKKRQKSCRTDHTGFSSVQNCKTEAAKFGKTLRDQCQIVRYNACVTCCGQPGMTKDTCAVKSPSGAFIDLAGPFS